MASGMRETPGEASGMDSPADGRLVRLPDVPHLAQVVPRLPAETLHQLIRYRGVEACTELLAAATPAQLESLLDLDLWKPVEAGLDERFDLARFGEWLDGLVAGGDTQAAIIVSRIDSRLVVAGLSGYIRVFDPATLCASSSGEDDDEPGAGPAPFSGLSMEIGGYVVRARSAASWDTIVALLLALGVEHCDYFHAVMRGCRRLSNSTPEVDGLDGLLTQPDQLIHDVGLARHDRRSRQGFLAPSDARAFLQMARQPYQTSHAAGVNPIAAAYFRSVGGVSNEPASAGQSLALAFLANALMAGCSVQARPFTQREASDAARATCHLGRELWSSRRAEEKAAESAGAVSSALARAEPAPSDEDQLTAFHAGWAALHAASLFVARHLVEVLKHVRTLDTKTHEGLVILRRELEECCVAGTPWGVRNALDVLAILDTVAWTGLLGVLDECPVVPDALIATVERRKSSVSATEFEFVSTTGQLAAIRAFARRLADVFLGSF